MHRYFSEIIYFSLPKPPKVGTLFWGRQKTPSNLPPGVNPHEIHERLQGRHAFFPASLPEFPEQVRSAGRSRT